MKKKLLSVIFLLVSSTSFAQNVGIGVSNPSARFQINHRTTATSPSLKLYDSTFTIGMLGPSIQFESSIGSEKWMINTTHNLLTGELNFLRNDVVMATLNGNGNFGIGINYAQRPLHVHGPSSTSGQIQLTNSLTGSGFNDGLMIGVGGTSSAFFWLHEPGQIAFATDDISRMVINSAGNVGIGTNYGLTEKLEVDGNVRITGEVNRAATGTSQLLPIAYGNISPIAVINHSSGNISVVRTGVGVYDIEIVGETYHYQTHVGVATITGATPGFVLVNSLGGHLLINTMNISGVQADRQFSFVVYRQ